MMNLAVNARAALHLICTVCDQAITDTDRDNTGVEVALFGAIPYAVCPGCNISVGRMIHDREYRRRARVAHFSHTGRVLPLGADDE